MVDLRTIMPLDVNTVADSVRKTHHLLIVDEGYGPFGVGAEIAQAMNELCFDELDAPVGRLHTASMSHPLAPSLENAMVVTAGRIVAAVRDVRAGVAPVADHWRALSRPEAGVLTAAPVAPASLPLRTAPTAQKAPTTPTAAKDLPGEPIVMPFGDLTVSEGKIVRWAKAPGDPVKAGELVAEIETDKAVVEIEAPATGKLGPIEQEVGAVVPMGGRIGAVVDD